MVDIIESDIDDTLYYLNLITLMISLPSTIFAVCIYYKSKALKTFTNKLVMMLLLSNSLYDI